MFDQLDDGGHEITLHRLGNPAQKEYPRSRGTLRWSANAGLSCSFVFSSPPFSDCGSDGEGPGVGRFSQGRMEAPDWTATTDDGTKVELFGVELERIPSYGRAFRFEANVSKAVIDIPCDRLLAFDNSTAEPHRLFFSGSIGWKYHALADVAFTDRNGGETRTCRGWINLSASRGISLVGANAIVGIKPAGWLAYESEPPGDYMASTPERLFVCFLNGRRIPFHWRDRREAVGMIRRTYFGWETTKRRHLAGEMSLPLDGIEADQHGDEVLRQLPILFDQFAKQLAEIDFSPVLYSMWVARETYLDYQMAIVSVAVEQLNKAWKELQDRTSTPKPSQSRSIWNDNDLKRKIEREFAAHLTRMLAGEITTSLDLDQKAELKRVLSSRITNLMKAPNENSLGLSFEGVGLKLSDLEKAALAMRNPSLHGKSLNYPLQVADLDQNAVHFDTLCMLITKFVLRISSYSGPYRDFASRPLTGNFEIGCLPAESSTE